MDASNPSSLPLPPLMREGGELAPAAVATLCEHPQFAAAMRALLADNVRLYRGNRILNYVGYDRGRLIVGILALYLYVTRRDDDPGSGLTAQRLKALCVEQDVCSAGRARAMLSLLQLFGYIERAPATDGRYKQLAPTPLLTSFLRERWSAMLGATALVLPEVAAARTALAREDFLAALVRGVIDQFRTGIRTLAITPALRPFAEHNAGLMILSSLALAGADDDTMPPSAPVHMSISELARRFSVSRTHVLRLFRDAGAHGLIERGTAGQETIAFTPVLSDALRKSVAMLFLFFAHCGRTALAETK
jgi:AraC-like DNA-binding protein